MKSIFTTSLLFALALFSRAQAPQMFNYQGVARDLSGTPLPNKNIGIQVSILSGSPTGVLQYAETHDVLTNNLGLFNLQIGSGNTISGSIGNIDWGSANHFLQIEMDENGGNNYKFIGTSQLLSVPYALYAENTGNSIWEKNADDIYYKLGRVGIGTNSPEFPLHVKHPTDPVVKLERTSDGYSLILDMNSIRTSQSNPDGFLSFGVNGDAGDIYISSPSRFVGIGTITPESKLQVHGGDVYIEDIGSGVIMKSPNGNCWRMTVDDTGQPVFSQITCPN